MRSTIQSRDGRPQGSRSRKRRKPSGDRRLSRRDGPSGPNRRRNGQAASVVEVGSRGAFGRAGGREADLRERGSAGRPARASPRSRPSGRDRCGKPFGASPQRRCQGALRSHAGTSASKHLAPSLRSGLRKPGPEPVRLRPFIPEFSYLRRPSWRQTASSPLLGLWQYSQGVSCSLS